MNTNIDKKRKAILLLAMLLTGGVASAQVVVKGSVYGGGQGIRTDTKSGLVTGNATVTMNGGTVERSIYGGGQLGSVGTFIDSTLVTYASGQSVYIPTTCAENTGLATVTVNGGHVGKNGSLMGVNPEDDDRGWIFCGGRGEADSINYPKAIALGVVGSTHLTFGTIENATPPLVTASVYGGCENGLVLEDTHVEIRGGQIGTGLVSKTQGENNVWTGIWDPIYDDETKWTNAINAVRSGNASDINAAAGQFHECDTWPYGDGNGHYYVYDINAGASGYNSYGGALQGSNGQTFFGNVFGGGSGYYPIRPGVWRRTAGQVNGNTLVEIKGGHILTSVYGGNEMTDVKGTCTVNMTGGTLGVPRTLAQIAAHPVTCYLFGAGKGDQRVLFNKWTNVQNAEVNIGGDAFFFGSVFGGGEDGHVLGNVTVNINTETGDDAFIGTWGYSYVDGNVFGGGRGFSGEALTAGSVGGNVTLHIGGGTMLGSIYGGGRLASVGTALVNVTIPDPEHPGQTIPNPAYGQMQPGEDHGNVTINITGGTIGNDYESKLHRGNPALADGRSCGGNVFGGSMGRLTLLNGNTNPLWPNLGKVKNTVVTIEQTNPAVPTIIKGNVYGGSELGTLAGNASVTIEGGTIWRNVFGGSFGSINTTMLAPLDVQTQDDPYEVTPMQRAGRIDGNTKVEIKGGWVKKCVYGAGEMASVGTITEEPVKHEDETQCFALSWPYEFKYQAKTGIDTVLVTGGRIGLTGKDYMGPWNSDGQPIYYTYDTIKDESGHVIRIDEIMHVYTLSTQASMDSIKAAREDNGDVYGGGKGKAGDRYVMAHCANSSNTVVIIEYPETNTAAPGNYKPDKNSPLCLGTIGEEVYDFVYRFIPTYNYVFPGLSEQWSTYHNRGCLPGSLYGGGENGHVNDSTIVTLNNGLVGHSVYGGGKGSDTYEVKLLDYTIDPTAPNGYIPGDSIVAQVVSITAGKVFGNTEVNINGGYVVRNVYGGGNLASVGKGNYADGPGGYQTTGYGEVWTDANAQEMQAILAASGHTYVNIRGGQIGTVKGMKDGLPTGNVFGSSRGEPVPNVPQTLSPRILYCPEFFLGYANHTHVTIGESIKPTPDEDSPRIYGSVYGGGQDGHVRWATDVVVNDAEIGNEYKNPAAAQELVGTSVLSNYQWAARGTVHGAGMGLGKYKDENNVEHYSTSSGSVNRYTNVTINGGLIHNNVYGGGPLASVGPPRIPPVTVDATHAQTLSKVTIRGQVGLPSDVIGGTYEENGETKTFSYGGNVFGGSRGVYGFNEFASFGTSIYTEINLDTVRNGNTVVNTAFVPGNVYGGGELGQVKQCTEVNVKHGTVGTIGYVRKNGTAPSAALDSIVHTSGGSVFGGGKGLNTFADAARVKDSTVVNIKGGHVLFNVYGGGEMASVGQHTEVHQTPGDNSTPVVDLLPVAGTGLAMVNVTGGQVGPAPRRGEGYNIPVGLNGVDGYVFGGGMGIGDDPISNEHPYGQYCQIANVNYTNVTVNIPATADTTLNRLWGSVFGGSEDGHVLGSDTVRFVSGFLGTKGTTSWDGNIFGGGRNFNKKNYTAGRTRGNNTVEMTGGQIFGNIYGGGRLALTGTGLRGLTLVSGTTDQYTPMITGDYGKTKVMVKGGIVGNNKLIETFSEHSMGNVYGGGMGDMGGINVQGHPAASALLLGMTKNTEVEISGGINDTHVYGIVFGGGETANVGQYTWKQVGTTVSDITITEGLAKVTVSGGTIGGDRSQMRYDLEDPSDPTNYWSKYNDDLGYVYGGGEGESDNPDRVDANNNRVYPLIQYGPNATETISLLDLMATVNNTDVTVSGGWVKASVFGGGESGHVRGNTKVTISGGQIGAGSSKNGNQIVDVLYNNGQFVDPLSGTISSSLSETYHWVYGREVSGDTIYTPFDPAEIRNNAVYDATTQTTTYNYIPSDGKSWFGNVFGGGSGWFPYVTNEGTAQKPNFVSHWNPNSGKVWGNTEVIITGGHILNNVYGANESTDVGDYGIADAAYHAAHPEVPEGAPYRKNKGGRVKVSISNGTVGVPRTNADIKKHPIISNVFGGGCGDPRRIFDNLTNVDSTYVAVTGGIVYGNVFGGAEDGHVLDSTNVVIGGGVIGSSGLSGYDGHVLGGGMGDEHNYDPVPASGTNPEIPAHPNFAVGRVQGNTHVKMTGGTALGNLYGGGNVALTGVDANGSFTSYINTSNVYDSTYHGRTMVEVSGGTIGNGFNNGLALLLSDNDLGNIYGGGRGKLDDLKEDDWGRAANAVVRISGNPNIYGSVFGGGQMANIGHWKDYTDWYTSKTGATHVTITGSPTIGTAKEFEYYSDEDDLWTWYDVINGLKMISHTCTGNVFGGGQGDVEVVKDNENNYLVIGTEQGHCGNTIIEISGLPTIMSSVFGGSEDGAVWGDTKVKIAGGTIGKEGLHAMELNASNQWVVSNQTYSFGNVFGGSYGKDAVIHLGYNDPSIIAQVNSVAGRVYGNTSVEITGGQVCGNVFGGANMASVGEVENNGTLKKGQTTVKVGGSAIIGPLDGTGLNAYVFGGGKGYHEDPDELRKAYANVNNTKVTVSLTTTGGASITPEAWNPTTHGGRIWGSAFGGGSDGHVLGNAEITVSGGLLGTTGTTSWDGNIFGGGRNFMASNLTNGRVGGNITVTMKGGTMLGSIFGGGRLANTGIDVNGEMQEGEAHGYTYVYVGKDAEGVQAADITIGHSATNHDDRVGGNVYGGAKGIAGAPTSIYPNLAKVKQTEVNIKEQIGKETWIEGSVFGGGEDGHVLQDTYVNIYGGQIGGASYGNPNPCTDDYHGNVYGGGRGLDTYEAEDPNNPGTYINVHSETAGWVRGNTNVNIFEGKIIRNVYGGGNVSSVGIANEEPQNGQYSTGLATVSILGGTIGTVHENENFGNVFGSAHGGIGGDYTHLAFVKNTHVIIGEDAKIYGSVFGGGEDGHVRMNTLVDVQGGEIGDAEDATPGSANYNLLDGNVYGGGRGLVPTGGTVSSTAGIVLGNSTVNIKNDGGNSPVIWNNVYGGGSASRVQEYKVVNISGGTVKQNVFGGSREIPSGRDNFAPRWVNMWGGTVEGSVFGCSYKSDDGNPMLDPNNSGHTGTDADNKGWASFVNMSGGTVNGSVYGAGYSGNVYGSVAVLIGKNAIESIHTDINTHRPATVTKDKLFIKGSVFGGTYGTPNQGESWNEFDVTGYSYMYVDGTGYNTTSTNPEDTDFMQIGDGTPNIIDGNVAIADGLYGSGTHCESGKSGRNMLLRNYGTRNTGDELTQASRSLATIQRGNIVLLDNANVNLTGGADISGKADATKDYGVLKVDFGLYATNGTGIVLGAANAPAYMDSIKHFKSLYLPGNATAYDQVSNPNINAWQWDVIGIQNDDNTLYRLQTNAQTALSRAQENVIIFNDISKLWVRYTQRTTNLYGELQGFFRMRGNRYQPYGTESFAYARPKITDGYTPNDNTADGGFLSYENSYNFFTDNGAVFTKTEQHPYTNVLYLGKDDRQEYREWVIPKRKGRWYVDGRPNQWGHDNKSKVTDAAGLFPDKPKKTIFGEVNNSTGSFGGIITEHYPEGSPYARFNYSYKNDVIYVVGALSAADEKAIVGGNATYTMQDSIGGGVHYPLKLYRYPGGHEMSNGLIDHGGGGHINKEDLWGVAAGSTAGPGANYGAMLNVGENEQITLQGVMMDGLYGFTNEDEELHDIPTDLEPSPSNFNPKQVIMPLVVTYPNATLTLNGGTDLKRGYNNNDAAITWYNNADFTPSDGVIHGGAVFVNQSATMNVSGKVTVMGNKQKNGDGEVECNVYLPTFDKSLNITSALAETTAIGITSPKRNNESSYLDNTLSPVAEATSYANALSAWTNCNFRDDQDWFFVNGNTQESPRTTYFAQNTEDFKLYFGWTWANVVRKAPTGFAINDIDSPEDLAWLITATDFNNKEIFQTDDIDMQQYVWVPVGTKSNPFKGTYDGQGHLIKNLSIDYIGDGDLRYERENYGLFGYVNGNGVVNRTFVVSGLVSPEGAAEMELGGLAGTLEGSAKVSNSEAAVAIESPNSSSNAGGLVGQMLGGTIHSSMAMPDFTLSQYGAVGGLAGITKNSRGDNPITPSIKNSFAQVKFYFPSSTEKMVGGLVGKSESESLSLVNNYSHLRKITPATSSNYVSLVAQAEAFTAVEYCYGDAGSYPLVNQSTVIPNNGKYTPVIGSDNLGYMYADNKIENDTSLFVRLNKNAMRMNKAVGDSTYAHWARPGLPEINGDLPVLLLNEFDEGPSYKYQGSFRSLATYAGGPALQYGGPVRDGDNNELSTMLGRDEYVFVYGDVDGERDTDLSKVTIEADKVSINEHATIKNPGNLATFGETYVGITFDNSYGKAYSTPGVNYGLVGMGGFLLPRDWHMFSTPLSNAPLGFDYMGDNVANSQHVNNPWVSTSSEFSWLNGIGRGRYWMKAYATADGYFPTQVDGTAVVENDKLFIVGSDECPTPGVHRFPYGMDFYTWYEPQYHWINFKRNGPNHWHSDENSQGVHEHLDYVPVDGATPNQNEDNLIVGKGYMASITIPTFMQSHGTLNNGDKRIALTHDGAHLTGWNLVGNPYHGYLDFTKFAQNENNAGVLTINAESQPFYVVYDADQYDEGHQGSGFLYYPMYGSRGGEYAGKFIHPHQGFYVKVADNAMTNESNKYELQFNESMVAPRSVLGSTSETDGHFRDEEQPAYPLVNLYLSSDKGCADVTVIEFGRPEWGGARKLKELRVGDGLFYAQHDDTHYAALFTVEGIERVPLWFEAKDDDIFTIKWNTANANFQSMYLVDNMTGVRYDMLRNNSYTFEGHKGDYPSRFYITFRFTDVEENQDHPFVFFDGSQWVVTGDGEVEFIDLLGQVLARRRVIGQTRLNLPEVAEGVYLFRLIEGQETKIQKVIVKK